MDPIPTLNGLVLAGEEPLSGVWWLVSGEDAIQGWWSSPEPVFESGQRPRAHGIWVGESFLPGRYVSITGYVGSGSFAATSEALRRLSAACSLTPFLLEIAEAGGQWWTMAQRSGEVLVKWISGTVARWSIQVLAADPRRFQDALVASTGLPSTSGGLTVPFTVPFSIGATVVTGQVSLTNPGNAAGPVKLRIDGPVTGPIVTHVSSGNALRFSSSLALSAGEFITVDMDRREVLAQGQVSRNGWVVDRGWSTFAPGDNVWAFSAPVQSAGRLTVEALPAWV